MRHPIRTKLYVIADLALAFTTLEAVRLPELPAADGDASGRTPDCFEPDCSASPQRHVTRHAHRRRHPHPAPRHAASGLR